MVVWIPLRRSGGYSAGRQTRPAAAVRAEPNRKKHEEPRGMPTFDEREKGFEAQFKHDQELQFKATARRNKLLGLWAAGLMGLSGADAEAYAREVVAADFQKPGDDDVVDKVQGDLKAKSIDRTAHQIRKQMEALMPVARQEIMKELGKK
jgi:hypothetical protein